MRMIKVIVYFFNNIFDNKYLFESNRDRKRRKTIFSKLQCLSFRGINIIIPEKNLKKETLAENGMNSISAISYQILNGKNGMPAFGGRLTEEEIEKIANYVLVSSWKEF